MPDVPFGLLVTEDDCSPEIGLFETAPVGAIGLTATNERSVLPASPLVYEFGKSAVKDALDRAGAHWGCPTHFAGDKDWAESVVDWCNQHGTKALVTAWVPVGPAATRLAGIEAKLEAEGITLSRVRRTFDEDAWPYAGRGYFKLKRQVPELLRQLGLEAELRETG